MLSQMQLVADIGKMLADKHGIEEVEARHIDAIIRAANLLCAEFNRSRVCPFCIASWEADMCRVLYHICYYAVASLHRQRMDAERAIPAWQLLTQECWYLLGPNPSWNPQT